MTKFVMLLARLTWMANFFEILAAKQKEEKTALKTSTAKRDFFIDLPISSRPRSWMVRLMNSAIWVVLWVAGPMLVFISYFHCK